MQYSSNGRQQRANPNVRQRPQRYPPPPPTNPQSSQSSSHRRTANNTHRRPHENNSSSRKKQFFLLGGSLLGLAIWYLTPVSDHVVALLLLQVPLEADVALGKQALRESEFGRQTVYHPHWTPLMQSVGWDLVAAMDDPSSSYYQWDFGVLEDPARTVNAFALPGGVVRVTSALLEQLALTEGELAALLGHEMGHVLHRHSQARILQQQLLGTILQALVYQDEDPHQENFGEAIGELLLQSADWLGRQSFSRSNEYQADAKSWELLTHSRRYNPQALTSLLRKLWDFYGRHPGRVPIRERWIAWGRWKTNGTRKAGGNRNSVGQLVPHGFNKSMKEIATYTVGLAFGLYLSELGGVSPSVTPGDSFVTIIDTYIKLVCGGFNGCSFLVILEIPESVQDIGANAFLEMQYLRRKKPRPQRLERSFSRLPDPSPVRLATTQVNRNNSERPPNDSAILSVPGTRNTKAPSVASIW